MIATLKADVKSLRAGLKGQDGIFYLGLFFIVLYYLRPQYIFSELLIIPWLQITIVLGLMLMFSKGRLEFKKEHFWVLMLACLAGLSALNSRYPEISSKNVTAPFIFFLEVLFLSNCVKNTQQLRILLIVFFLCVFKMSFFGARVWAGRGFSFTDWGIQGPPGFFQNSGEYTLLMAMVAVMSIPFIQTLKPKTRIYWLLPLTAIMATLGASSRGGQLALLVGLIFLLISYKKIKLKNLVYILILVSLLWAVFPEQQKARFMTAGEDKTSTTRLSYWTAGIDMALDNPILGVGLNTFPEHYSRFYKVNDGSYLAQRKEVSHNSLIQAAANLGLPALLIYLYLHWLVYKSPKKPRQLNTVDSVPVMDGITLALKSGVIVYFVGAFFMSVVFYPYIYFLLSISIATKRIYQKEIGRKLWGREA